MLSGLTGKFFDVQGGNNIPTLKKSNSMNFLLIMTTLADSGPKNRQPFFNVSPVSFIRDITNY